MKLSTRLAVTAFLWIVVALFNYLVLGLAGLILWVIVTVAGILTVYIVPSRD